jgi:ribosomal protein L5
MQIFETHYKQIIKYDLLTKFNYKNFYSIPKLKSIVLNFGIKEVNFKLLVPILMALELISSQKGLLTKAKKPNIKLILKKKIINILEK